MRPAGAALGELLDPGSRIEARTARGAIGIRVVPAWIKRRHVPQELIDAHPARQVGLFRQVADAGEDADRIGDRIGPNTRTRPDCAQ